MLRRAPLVIALVVSALAPAAGQTDRAARFMENCNRNRNDYAQFCETRDFTLPVSQSLSVDGRQNGGIAVHGWNRNEVHVVAMVQTQAETDADASALARSVAITTSAGSIGATGPDRNSRHESWSVSYEIWTPSNTNLTLTAMNGGISVDNVVSQMDLETLNGGLNLTDVDGNVRGTTTNGGVTVNLSGDRWHGTGLDLKTTNGGVHINVPSNYSAMLEAGTVNGGLDLGFPITVQGTVGRRLTTQLGAGGATIRAITTNGGVSVRRR
jgi:DUF4097 and DUF4098 domain-containing protein YvlB